MTATVRLAQPDELPACHEVRHAVFVLGQGVPASLEVDGRDADCVHAVARLGDRVVGTARLRDHQGHAKAERVAVLADQRGTGLGLRLMHTLEDAARSRGYSAVHLHAQMPVVPFYERLGYVAEGEVFEEAGIEHLAMCKALG